MYYFNCRQLNVHTRMSTGSTLPPELSGLFLVRKIWFVDPAHDKAHYISGTHLGIDLCELHALTDIHRYTGKCDCFGLHIIYFRRLCTDRDRIFSGKLAIELS